MPDFGFGERIDLPYDVRLRGVEVAGSAGDVVRAPASGGGPVRDVEPGTLPDALDASGAGAAAVLGDAAERAGLRPALTVPLSGLTPARADGGADRQVADRPHVELTVPAPADDEGQVVLEVDDTGTVHWHLADPVASAAGDRAVADQTFRIPVTAFDVPGEAPDADRGIFSFGLRTVLHVLRFPVQAAAGAVGELAVALWERRFRPYGLDLVTADTLGRPLDGPGVSASRLAELAGEPFLLLVHGTFSRARSAFDALAADPALMSRLQERYRDRILVFDHPTLHVDPDANVSWLLDRLPAGVPLTFDVLSHSRGGLVGRRIGAPAEVAGRTVPRVRTLVHVATPNAGTVLAGPKRWTTLLDVFTNLLSLLPDDPAGISLSGVLEVVKQVATGVLEGLDGLAAMDPDGDWLRTLDAGVPDGSTVRAVASDWEPGASSSLPARALDLLVDPFFGTGNDVVVPTEGVYRGAGGYTVPDPFVVPVADAVAHTGYFADPGVRAALDGWLPG